MPDTSNGIRGRIFDIQRFSIHDGPGIRTTVFLKGCPLDCVWCHNPEGISPAPNLAFAPDLCIGCGYCFRTCPNRAHRVEGGRHLLDRESCTQCGLCARECYARAIEYVGRDVSIGEVLDVVVRDRPFYDTSRGGMTLSGGEPAFQPDFAAALLEAADTAGIDCCVETCGHCAYAILERFLPYVSLFLYDIKETDLSRHRRFTHVSNDRILENLRRLHATGARIRLRCPIVPGLNDRDDHFEALAALADALPDLEGIEIMPYHALGESKSIRFGLAPGIRAETPPLETVAKWANALRGHGITVFPRAEQTPDRT